MLEPNAYIVQHSRLVKVRERVQALLPDGPEVVRLYPGLPGQHLRVGVFFLQVDDNVVPFAGTYAISDATLVNLSPFIACCTTLLGGHLSFLDWRGRSWADRVVVEFFAAAARRLPASQISEDERRKRTKMRRSPSWREAAPRASPPEKRPPAKPAAATPVSERRRALPSVKGVLAGM